MQDFILQFTLKQHTSLLHFQHEQAGATLRPTEVKTKLDRFIWQEEWNNDFEKGKDNMVGYSPGKSADLKQRYGGEEQYRALDYKVQLTAQDVQISEVPQKMPLYFGNMSNENEEKKEKHFVFARGGVSGRIMSGDPALLRIVRKHLPAFFRRENFGTRQNKGFGSFEVSLLDGVPPAFAKPSGYFFTVKPSDEAALREHIDLFYRSLRSGINLKGGGQTDRLYFKSLLFQYAKTKEHQWDKRKIRKDLFGNHPKFQPVEDKRRDPEGTVGYDRGTPMLYRDMLGLSSSQSWYSYNATVTKTAKNPDIDRFKSPITFKPFRRNQGWEVYILAHPVPAKMKNTGFIIESGRNKTELYTPEFDLHDYLKFAFSYFDEQNTVEDYVGDNQAPREVRILESIYQQLRNQI